MVNDSALEKRKRDDPSRIETHSNAKTGQVQKKQPGASEKKDGRKRAGERREKKDRADQEKEKTPALPHTWAGGFQKGGKKVLRRHFREEKGTGKQVGCVRRGTRTKKGVETSTAKKKRSSSFMGSATDEWKIGKGSNAQRGDPGEVKEGGQRGAAGGSRERRHVSCYPSGETKV